MAIIMKITEFNEHHYVELESNEYDFYYICPNCDNSNIKINAEKCPDCYKQLDWSEFNYDKYNQKRKLFKRLNNKSLKL